MTEEVKAQAAATPVDDEDVVTPFEITAKDDTGVDYEKLIDKYGCFPITPELIERLERAIRGDEAGPLFDVGAQGLGRLAGVPKSAVAPLFEGGLRTVGDLERFIAQGSPESALDRLMGAAPALVLADVELVLNAFERFQATGRLDGLDGEA